MPDDRKDIAVTFVTDNGFLIPSIVAALQVIEQPAVRQLADVLIFTVEVGQDTVAELNRIIAGKGITFVAMSSESFVPSANVQIVKSHIPKTALGRLAIDKFLPAQYQHIVYLDGDIQIAGDLEPLVSFRVPPGFVAAASEFLWLTEGDIGGFWQKHKAYLAKLGITQPKEYFNSGVMAADRATWAIKSQEALRYFEKHSSSCLYLDQSALNAVCRGSVKYLSPYYNFTSVYASLEMNAELTPKVIHFTGGGKPWNHIGSPWNGRFHAIYRDFVRANPTLSTCIDTTVRAQTETGSALSRGREAILGRVRLARRQRAMRKFMATENFATR